MGSPCVAIMKVVMGMRPQFADIIPKDSPVIKLCEMCWCVDPHQRLTFKDVLTFILKVIEEEDNQ